MKDPRKLLLLIFSLVLSLVMLEIGLRIMSEPKYFSRSWLMGYCQPDKDLVFSYPAFKKVVERNYTAISGKPLVVTLGDSYTSGSPVAKESSFPSVLQNDLKILRKNAEVINLGFSGYGTDQEFAVFQKFLQAGNRPKVVVWTFFPNDIYENQSQAVYTLGEKDELVKMNVQSNWIYIRQFLYNLIPLPNQMKVRSYLVKNFLSTFERLEYSPVPKEYNTAEEKRDWAVRKMKAQVAEMQKLSQKYNFALHLVLIAPQKTYLNEEEVEVTELDWLLTDLQTQYAILSPHPNFMYINFNNMLSAESPILGTTSDFASEYFDNGLRDPLPLGYRHFNESGYRVFAELVREAIKNDL